MTGPNYGLLDNALVNKNRAMEGYGAANALYSQALENQAARVGIENAMAERAAGQAAGGDINKYQQNLMALGQGKQSVAIGKAVADINKTGTEAINSRMAAYRSLWDNVTTPDEAAQRIVGSYADPILGPFLKANGMTPEKSLAMLNQASQSPQSFQQFVRTAQIGTDKMINHMIDIEQRQRGTVPAGYRMTPEGNLEAIPGGPTTTPLAPKELQKRNADYPVATSAITGYETKADNFVKDLKALRDHPGLADITGIAAGRLPGLTKEGRAAQALYDKIVAKGGFQALQDLRAASKTGGALGNVSNQEGKQLVQSFAAIDRRQDAPDVIAAIDQAIADVEGSKTRMREAYDATYEYKNATPAAGGGKGNQKWQSALTDFENQGGGRK